jgi:hypothetical protein
VILCISRLLLYIYVRNLFHGHDYRNHYAYVFQHDPNYGRLRGKDQAFALFDGYFRGCDYNQRHADEHFLE